MTKPPASESENTLNSADSKQYRGFLQRKVDAARLSQRQGQYLSNEEIETKFAARRAQAAE
ncbi:hypothetical protein DJ564_01830 [Pseudomonas sp. 31-12]|uniref:hypothetical protein n=1 Tax=Pseudomonas sp. 31-12 TaxID=2201356 RepID=UPI000D6D83C1|nr:hypothetical protein [Pseudomonas sp. 31-12]AWM89626.1 hypothetical protein DJ564_01830 [Pseudomonas sp. 31-12]